MDTELLDASWPKVDDTALVTDQIRMVVQVNGKLRGEIEISKDAGEEEIHSIALSNPGVSRHVGDSPVRNFVIVPGRLINIVL